MNAISTAILGASLTDVWDDLPPAYKRELLHKLGVTVGTKAVPWGLGRYAAARGMKEFTVIMSNRIQGIVSAKIIAKTGARKRLAGAGLTVAYTGFQMFGLVGEMAEARERLRCLDPRLQGQLSRHHNLDYAYHFVEPLHLKMRDASREMLKDFLEGYVPHGATFDEIKQFGELKDRIKSMLNDR